MKMKSLLAAASALLVPALLIPSVDAVAQDTKSVAGTWQMVSNITTDPAGKKMKPFGDNPRGTMILTADGKYSIVVAKPDLPKIAANSRDKGTAEENKAIVGGSIGHAGTYKLSEADKALVFSIENSTYANWNGTTQKRVYTLKDDTLSYLVPAASTGGTSEVVWKRVK